MCRTDAELATPRAWWPRAAVFASVLMWMVGPGAGPRASAEGLAERAARERQRRTGKVAKKITDEDLKKVRAQRSTEVVAPPPTPVAAVAAVESSVDARDGGDESEEGDREERSAIWRATLQEAREEADALSRDAEQLRQELGDVRDGVYGAARTSRSERLARLSQQAEATQQRITLLEEAGRRGGYRP